jgi:hypothetical protein
MMTRIADSVRIGKYLFIETLLKRSSISKTIEPWNLNQITDSTGWNGCQIFGQPVQIEPIGQFVPLKAGVVNGRFPCLLHRG